MEENARTLAAILEALAEVGAQHALFGGLVEGYYGKGRATADVDLLIARRFVKQVRAALERRGYLVRQFPYSLKIYVPGKPEPVGDLVEQESNCVLRAAFLATTPVVMLGLPVSIVRRGVFVALKFQAVTTPRRRPRDRTRDVLDIRGVLQKEFGPEDERLALEIASKMYPGAAADLKVLIDDLQHGRWPKITRRTAICSGMLVRRGLATLWRKGALARYR